MHPLRDKTILVTAASSRTGAAICRWLLGQGAEVVLVYRQNLAGAQAIRQEFPQSQSWALQADVTDEASVTALAAQVRALRPRLWGLINVVGDWHQAPILETPYADFRSVIQSNLDSVFLLSKACHPLLRGGGRIINFGWALGDRVIAAEAFAYQIAKLGVLSLSRSLAKQWGPEQISVNCISPGHLENSIVKESETAKEVIPQGRFGTYEDLFPLLELLLSEGSTYLTGSNFILSGGYNL